MAEDLRRKLILKQMSNAENAIRGMPSEKGNESEDTVGELPTSRQTIRTNKASKGQEGPDSPDNDNCCSWKDFFGANERIAIKKRNLIFNTYFTLPKSQNSGAIPVFLFHHGGGSSALTFANLSKQIQEKLAGNCATFAFDARGHGQTRPIDDNELTLYDLGSFIDDFVALIEHFYIEKLAPLLNNKLSFIMVGHSLGGSICTSSYSSFPDSLKKNILGIAMFDIVEEAAIMALQKVNHFLSQTPNIFNSYVEAIDWHVQNGLSKCIDSAQIAIPALFERTDSQKIARITNLRDFEPYWDTWFHDLSHKFVELPCSKLLVLAGNDNLDKELIIGQMQGKYQLVVFQDSGHFIQEDAPIKAAITLIDFYRRNDTKNITIKSNWGSKK